MKHIQFENEHVKMIQIIARSLESLNEDVVFIGGAAVSLYFDTNFKPSVRTTKDVDLIIRIGKYSEYSKLERELEKIGYRHVIENNTPICRWSYNNILVDVMPTSEEILGFANKWYEDGFDHRIPVQLPENDTIYILALPYFIATKIEAFKFRGGNDARFSEDIEDIVTVLDGRVDDHLFQDAPNYLKKALKDDFAILLKDESFIESIEANLDAGADRDKRFLRIINLLKEFCGL